MRALGLASSLVLVAGCSAIVSPDESRLGGGSDAGVVRDAGGRADGGGGVDGGGLDAGEGDAGGGDCSPGEGDRVPCGMCGTAPRTCSSAGRWETGTCEGEGACMAGETVRIACGLDGTVEGTCSASCEMPALSCPLDVMLLLDRTGSHNDTINENASNIVNAIVTPLLAAGDVRIGVSVFADYPYRPYGDDRDRPFLGVLAPTDSAEVIASELSSLPAMNGNDYPESAVEALYVLSGGVPHSTSLPLTCEPGLAEGGCWRRNAEQAIVVVTDVAQHNMPSPTTDGLVSPYDDWIGAPTWMDVRPRLEGRIGLFALVRDRGETLNDGSRQLRALARSLGQDPDRSIVEYSSGDGAVALGPQLRELGGLLLARYFP